MTILSVLAFSAAVVNADIYLHNPRGSNNRLSSDNRAVNNPRRLFNSMNSWMAKNNGANTAYDGGYNAAGRGFNMKYFVGSLLPIEFTINQGCGTGKTEPGAGENSAHCDIILQYMCSDQLRDGASEDTIPMDNEGMMQWKKTEGLGLEYMYGMHENWDYMMACNKRERNMGLFVADRVVTGKTARFTRQNPTGTQWGYECPEERDYYPYWAPSPWRDIAILTSDVSKCDYYQSESQNVARKGYCEGDLTVNREENCPTWKEFKPWKSTHADITAPECLEAPWVSDSMHANDLTGYPITYNWTIPDEGFAGCVIRVRYNVSMGDYEGWNIGERKALSSVDNADKSPVNTKPLGSSLAKCCDTEKDGLCQCSLQVWPSRAPFNVMQDRSHRFQIIPRPKNLRNTIHNLNVRGKRGNIVQTFPTVEHDFVPNVLHCRVGEWMHIQWTGSDNNRQNVAGEGTDQTDRSCIVQTETGKHNYPIDWESQNLFSSTEAIKLAFNDLQSKENTACKPFNQLLQIQNTNDREEDAKNCAKLNPTTPYYDGGLQPCRQPGTYYYMSWRENNFSNRSQKGAIVVSPCEGKEECMNNDVIPVNSNDEYDPYAGTQYEAAANTLPALVALLAAVFAFFF